MNPPRRHRFGVAAALAVAGALTGAGVLACGRETTPPVPPSSTVTPAAPTRMRWQPFQGIDLPVADQGPLHIDGPVASGFDRSPAGAALAAIQATVRMSIASDSQWPPIGQRMLAPGPGRDAWATARAQISITSPITDGAPQVRGYVIARYTLDAADIDIYSLHPDTSLTRNSTHVLWHGGDWRLHLPGTPTAAPVTAVAVPPADMVALTPH